MNITANQLSAIDRLVTEFRGDRLAVTEVQVTVVESAWGDAGVCVSLFHPGFKTDGSDWSFHGTTVYRDGSEVGDNEPVAPVCEVCGDEWCREPYETAGPEDVAPAPYSENLYEGLA